MENFEYQNEELEEIEYYEIISFEEKIKLNPTFVAFSNEEIFNHLISFVKSKSKAEGFLKLFNDIIEKQRQSINTNNFIILTDATRGYFVEKPESKEGDETFILNEFVNKIKNSNKEQVQIAFKNKNKIWFPLVYNDESTKLKFTATNTTILELSKNNYYIIFKDDERNIPIMGVYFYEPKVDDTAYLNEKIGCYLISDKNRVKLEVKLAETYSTFEELIKDYEINIPFDRIDEDDYNYSSLTILLKKFNHDLDFIDVKNFELIKSYLIALNSKEIINNVEYSKIKIKNRDLTNNRFIFYQILQKTNKLIDITLKSVTKLKSDLEILKKEKNFIETQQIHKDLYTLITNINNDNYNDIINNLREIRRNLSIDNSIDAIERYINTNLNEIDDKFKCLTEVFTDIFKIDFKFDKDIKEIKKGNDVKDYEGIPIKIDEFKKNAIYIDENDDDEIIEEIAKDNELDIYYNNYYFNLEKGFSEALKIVLPFIVKMQELCKLPLDLKIITNHLFNIHRGIPEKFKLIRNKYQDRFDEEHCREQALKSINYVLNSDTEDKLLKDANIEYIGLITEMLYDVICKWSIELQKELLDETLLYNKDIYYIPCYELWNEFGAPYNLRAKDGILYYLICIFADVFKEYYTENDINYLPLDKSYKIKIVDKLNNDYIEDLKYFKKFDIKKKKENKGLEAQKQLVKLLQAKDYNNDKFFETFIQSLIYMPSVKFEKIHKYLLGCCLEQIDSEFTADKFFKTNRKDLEKAKAKFASERVLNKKRYNRFYLYKENIYETANDFKGIIYKSLIYPIYENTLDNWFDELDETTYLTESNIKDIKTKLLECYQIHTNNYLGFFGKKPDYIKKYSFNNYSQILLGVSKILFTYLNDKAFIFIKKINKTIEILDKLNSIINDDNETDIEQIRTIIVIRGICLPSIPDIKKTVKLNPSIEISNEIYKQLFTDIKIKIFKIIEESKMPTMEEQIDYINKMREENKDKILTILNKKTREEKDILKELKKIGLEPNEEDDDIPIKINKEKTDKNLDIEGENEFNLEVEDAENDYFEKDDYGFIYAD